MKSLRKNIFREIWQTKSRFIAISAIIALSIGFFSGVKVSAPSLINTADIYFEENKLMDFRIVSSIGFDDDDIADIAKTKGVTEVMPSYMADVITNIDNTDSVVRIHAVPTSKTSSVPINSPNVIEGRLPEKSGECVIENTKMVKNLGVGDTLKILPKVGDNDTSDYLKRTEYKIVGIVESPQYITFQHGNTNVGNGSILFYAMIPPEDFAYEKYTEVYLKTEASADGISSFSDEYKSKIAAETQELNKLEDGAAERFNNGTLADAKKELADAKEEYESKKQEAEKKISDAEKELTDGKEEFATKIADAENEIAENEQKLNDAREELKTAKETYSTKIKEAEEKIALSEKELNDGKEEYQKSLAEFTEEISSAQKKIDTGLEEYKKANDEFVNITKPNALAQLEDVKTNIDTLNASIKENAEMLEQLQQIPQEYLSDEQKQQIEQLSYALAQMIATRDTLSEKYDEGQKSLNEGEAKLTAAKAQLDTAQQQLDERSKAAQEQLDNAKSKLDSGEEELNQGKKKLEEEKASGKKQIEDAESEIADGEAKLAEGKKELEDKRAEGQEEIDNGEQELADAKAEAEEKLADGEKKIADAEKELEDVPEVKWYVYDRNDNKGYSGLVEDAERVNSIAKVFPVFFLIVAVLVCLTTMTRLVEERRTEIGTMKALGYSSCAIASKYFIYALAAGVFGSIIGAFAGFSTLPQIIIDAYGILYALPPMKLYVEWDVVIISACAAILCTCLVAVFTCIKELKLRPAVLMRPRAPKPGKRIILEKIPFLWKHMSFTSKVTARNILRYKARFLMTVIGVAGCTALVVAAFGLKYSISTVADLQFNELFHYDTIMALKDSKTESGCKEIWNELKEDGTFSVVLPTYSTSSKLYKQKDEKQVDATCIVPNNIEDFTKLFTLRSRTTKEPVALSNNGVVISERLSEVIGINVGDSVTAMIDDVPYAVKVTGITENYASNYVYMTPQYYKDLLGGEVEYNSMFIMTNDAENSDQNAIASKWMKNDEILTASFISDTVSSVNDMFGSLDFVVVVMILCAGALAIVVLYNLTNINIAERVREIATIKVLGFYNGESAAYIYRENIVLTVVGAFVGLLLGLVFSRFIIQTIEMDMVMFSRRLSIESFVFGFVMTCAFSFIVNFIMYFKMKKIDMVESLKSVE